MKAYTSKLTKVKEETGNWCKNKSRAFKKQMRRVGREEIQMALGETSRLSF